MIAFAIGPNLYVTSEPATWIDSTTGQPIGDSKRGACYWRLDVVKVPDQAVLAVARTIRLEEPAPQEKSDAEHDQDDRRDRRRDPAGRHAGD